MRVLVIGKEGQLGSTLSNLIIDENFATFVQTGLDELDITNEGDVRKIIEKIKPDYIINCTAFTAVVNAEFEAELARKVNAIGVKNIGKYASSIGAGVIHISTDYVFDGKANTPLTPDMEPNPLSVYGKTKLEGENFLLNENSKSIIIRTSWLYSPYGQNFMKTMLGLGTKQSQVDVVYDQAGTPTYSFDLAKVLLHILKRTSSDPLAFKPGIYHYSNEGVCTWYDFAQMIYRIAGINCLVNPVRTDVIKSIAPRPAYSVLDKTAIKKEFDISIPYWADSLKECISKLEQNKK